jgi:hypothetical protein
MNTNQSNVSFLSVRVFCSKAKTRLLLLAFLLCLNSSAWAQSLPFNLTMPDVLMLFRGRLVAAENHQGYAPSNTPTVPLPGPTPIGLPFKGPSPDGTPYAEPPGSRR